MCVDKSVNNSPLKNTHTHTHMHTLNISKWINFLELKDDVGGRGRKYAYFSFIFCISVFLFLFFFKLIEGNEKCKKNENWGWWEEGCTEEWCELLYVGYIVKRIEMNIKLNRKIFCFIRIFFSVNLQSRGRGWGNLLSKSIKCKTWKINKWILLWKFKENFSIPRRMTIFSSGLSGFFFYFFVSFLNNLWLNFSENWPLNI